MTAFQVIPINEITNIADGEARAVLESFITNQIPEYKWVIKHPHISSKGALQRQNIDCIRWNGILTFVKDDTSLRRIMKPLKDALILEKLTKE